MEVNNNEVQANVNRVVWMIIFMVVAVALAAMEWKDQGFSLMGWFLATGIWSAICGISYSICDWLILARSGENTSVSNVHSKNI